MVPTNLTDFTTVSTIFWDSNCTIMYEVSNIGRDV